MNQDLVGLLPYNLGSVTIDAGLIALQGNNDIKNLIKAVGSISSLLAVTQLSAIIKVAEPLADIVAALVGATNGKLMIGLNQTFSEKGGGTEAVLRSGYYAMLDARAGEYAEEKFWVDRDYLKYGDSMDTSEQLTGMNYMLLRIERRDERKDWDAVCRPANGRPERAAFD